MIFVVDWKWKMDATTGHSLLRTL